MLRDPWSVTKIARSAIRDSMWSGPRPSADTRRAPLAPLASRSATQPY